MSHCTAQTALSKLHCTYCIGYTVLVTLHACCNELCGETALHAHFTAKLPCTNFTALHKLHCTYCIGYTVLVTLHACCNELCGETALHAHFTAKLPCTNFTALHKLHCTHCTVHTALLILYTTVVLHSKMQCYNNAMVDFTVQISSLSSSVCVHGPSKLA